MNDSTGLFEDYKTVQDGQSLARLLEHHQEPVLRICRRVLRHPQDAEDACQEVLLEISRQARTIQQAGTFSAWLYQTALHTALDHRRKRGRDRLREDRVRAAAPTRAPRDLNETLYEGLERLDEPSRALIVEHHLAGRPLRELAVERGCSEVSIWKRLRKVRERLRSNIGSAAMAALGNSGVDRIPGGLWGRLLSLKGGSTISGLTWAVAAPLGVSALVGLVLISRSEKPPAPELPGTQAVAPLPRLAEVPSPLPLPAPPAPSPVLPKAGEQSVVPKIPSPRKPYPYKLPAPAAPGGAVWAWTVLNRTRVTLDEQGLTLPQFLAAISRQTGLRFNVDADLPKASMTIQVSDMVADGALRLMFFPSRMDYEIQANGAIRVGMAEDIKGGFERTARAAEAPFHELASVAKLMEEGWDGLQDPSDRTPKIEGSLARKIAIPQGETTLLKEIDRLAKAEGVRVLLDGDPAMSAADFKAMKDAPFLQVVEERPLRAHLEQLAARAGGVLVTSAEDMFLVTTPQKAADLRSKEESEGAVYGKNLKLLSTTLPDGGTFSVQDFAESVQTARGIPIIPSEAAWNSEASFSLQPASTLRQGLDELKAQGFRWALLEGKLYILK